jgi:hypothetical protein
MIISYDLAGVSEISGSNAFLVEFDSSQMERIGNCCQPSGGDFYYGSASKCGFVKESIEFALLLGTARLTTWWLSKIAQHPLAYPDHRIRAFGSFSRLGYPESYYVIHPGIDENDLGLTYLDSELFNTFKSYILSVKDECFMRPWFWLVLNMSVCAISTAHWREPLPCAAVLVSLSGAVYILSYLPFGITGDFRYAYWGVLSALAAFFVIAFRARNCPSDHRHRAELTSFLTIGEASKQV